jgi:regulatory protein
VTEAATPRARLLRRAVALLARREHGRAELARKLKARLEDGQDPADVDAVLSELAANDLLSDARYAAAVVRARGARYGDARIAHDLKARGVSAELAKAAVGGLDDELQRARAIWQRRFGALPSSTEERARQSRFLHARGFSGDVIRRLLRGAPADADDTAL